MDFPQFLKNKKFVLLSVGISLVGLSFLISASPASAAGCGKNQGEFSFSSFLNPVASLVEKVVKDFGYDIALAAPVCTTDFCGGDCVDCSGSSSTATIDWSAAPSIYSEPGPPTINHPLSYYILTVSGVGWNTGLNTSYTVSGLANNSLYNWSVEAYYRQGVYSSAAFGFTNQPYGSFTTGNCTPPPPPGDFSLSLGPAACNSVPLTWTASSNITGYWVIRDSPRVDITPYQPYTAQNFTDTTVSQNTTYIYQIEAYNAAGTNRSNALNVTTPYCPPTVNLSANPTSIYQGQSSTLSWSSTNSTSCVASGAWSGSKPLNGSQVVVPLPPPQVIYTLTCSGPGGSASGSATINITPLALPNWQEIIPR